MFVPTGLVGNPDYLTWDNISTMAKDGLVLMANHTWSHHSMGASNAVIEKEISTAKQQLADHNLDKPQIFAYPYGLSSAYAEKYLAQSGYQVAFTTKRGRILCEKQRMTLPRVRVGNAS